MREKKFSETPWELCQDDHGDFEKHFSFHNADIYIGGEGDELKANAHLIAAAPMLLDALEGMVRLFPTLNNIELITAYDNAQKAIAKAYGE